MSAKRRILPLFIPHLGCPHACVFCNQRQISGTLSPVTPADVAAALSRLPEGAGVEAAFYGGSFTALPLEEQAALLAAVQPFRQRGIVDRIRLSTRPDAVDDAVLKLLLQNGVGTVELGAQSMDDAVLARCGRGHRVTDTVNASALVKGAGLQLVLQMMTGLPGSTPEKDAETARRLITLGPDAVRIYPTVILRNTPLYALWQSGEYREHTVEDAVAVCSEILPLFDAAGIPVIRLGLNPTEELSGGEAAGGAYHPALGELVRSRMALKRARMLLEGAGAHGEICVAVPTRELSCAIGQHRSNVRTLEAEFGLSRLRFVPAELAPGEMRLIDCCPASGGVEV